MNVNYSIQSGRRTYYIPDRMMDSIIRYHSHGVIPGDFLQAVICNDLREAVFRADEENMANLPAYVSWFYERADHNCWGSREKMVGWNKVGGLYGQLALHDLEL